MGVSRDALPSAFIVLPLLLACAVTLIAVVAAGAIAGLAVGVIAALASALLVEKPLKHLASITDKIAAGDRYAILPRQTPGPLSDIARAVEHLRATVLEADALAVDQRRREAEVRLHMASRSFFTRSFRGAVDEVTKMFSDGGAWIGQTAADLEERNRAMHGKVAGASDTARSAADDIAAIGVSARGILRSIEQSADDIGASRAASTRATGDLASADETMRGLASDASRIDEVVGLIQKIARQTSMLPGCTSIRVRRWARAISLVLLRPWPQARSSVSVKSQ